MKQSTEFCTKSKMFSEFTTELTFVPNKPKKKFDDGTNYVEKPKKTKKSKFNKNKRSEILI